MEAATAAVETAAAAMVVALLVVVASAVVVTVAGETEEEAMTVARTEEEAMAVAMTEARAGHRQRQAPLKTQPPTPQDAQIAFGQALCSYRHSHLGTARMHSTCSKWLVGSAAL